MCSSSQGLNTDSRCAGTRTTLMSVSNPAMNNFLNHTHVKINLAGWVKKQSLRGIVDWFHNWLALESSPTNIGSESTPA